MVAFETLNNGACGRRFFLCRRGADPPRRRFAGGADPPGRRFAGGADPPGRRSAGAPGRRGAAPPGAGSAAPPGCGGGSGRVRVGRWRPVCGARRPVGRPTTDRKKKFIRVGGGGIKILKMNFKAIYNMHLKFENFRFRFTSILDDSKNHSCFRRGAPKDILSLSFIQLFNLLKIEFSSFPRSCSAPPRTP